MHTCSKCGRKIGAIYETRNGQTVPAIFICPRTGRPAKPIEPIARKTPPHRPEPTPVAIQTKWQRHPSRFQAEASR